MGMAEAAVRRADELSDAELVQMAWRGDSAALATSRRGRTTRRRMMNERVIAMFRRFFALVYDRINQPAETAGLSQERQKLLAQASGETIEIGAGTGLNLAHYPAAVTRLVLTEPDRYMARRLRRRVAAVRPDAEVLDAAAARLPFPDASFDTAVVTFVLCSVPDPGAALTEIARVLRHRPPLPVRHDARLVTPGRSRWRYS